MAACLFFNFKISVLTLRLLSSCIKHAIPIRPHLTKIEFVIKLGPDAQTVYAQKVCAQICLIGIGLCAGRSYARNV